jgi:hypothetical protein
MVFAFAASVLLPSCSSSAFTKSAPKPITPIPVEDRRAIELLVRELYRPGSTAYRIDVTPNRPEDAPNWLFSMAEKRRLLRDLRAFRKDVLFEFEVRMADWPVPHARDSVAKYGTVLFPSGRIVYQASRHDDGVWPYAGLLCLESTRERPRTLRFTWYGGREPNQWGEFVWDAPRRRLWFDAHPPPIIN